MGFTNWHYGQPNNIKRSDIDQDFASISYDNSKWGDWYGATSGMVICQQEYAGKRSLLVLLSTFYGKISNQTSDCQIFQIVQISDCGMRKMVS